MIPHSQKLRVAVPSFCRQGELYAFQTDYVDYLIPASIVLTFKCCVVCCLAGVFPPTVNLFHKDTLLGTTGNSPVYGVVLISKVLNVHMSMQRMSNGAEQWCQWCPVILHDVLYPTYVC